MTRRSQLEIWAHEERDRRRAERREVYARFVTAARVWQSNALNPAPIIQERSAYRGIAYVDVGTAYDETIRALAEVQLIAATDKTVAAALAWEEALRTLARQCARTDNQEGIANALEACHSVADQFISHARDEFNEP